MGGGSFAVAVSLFVAFFSIVIFTKFILLPLPSCAVNHFLNDFLYRTWTPMGNVSMPLSSRQRVKVTVKQ